ncbi:PiggyBac transposable element-derived protein 4 [Plakobranchus ocellatus]|uniref:PiggyBac transposable element-derived protein 4 n=1 Tax=Plakobranchus ocellatus TaxID=259542 RepID=A0AAV4BXS5_9GAST|nr:PiggyBac transposable element-derived protein 4 [Plakobranchus ocellatus]
MRLLQPLLDQSYGLYVDNYYCWNQMQRRNTMLVGTCRKNRVGMPADLFQNRQRPGDFDFRRKGQLVANCGLTRGRRCRTNLASVFKEVSVALVDKDVIYDPQDDNGPLPMDRLKGRHFLSVCPNTEASDSRGKKARRRCQVCAVRAKTAGQTPAERKNKRKLTTRWCREYNVGLCLDCFEIYHTKRDYINN